MFTDKYIQTSGRPAGFKTSHLLQTSVLRRKGAECLQEMNTFPRFLLMSWSVSRPAPDQSGCTGLGWWSPSEQLTHTHTHRSRWEVGFLHFWSHDPQQITHALLAPVSQSWSSRCTSKLASPTDVHSRMLPASYLSWKKASNPKTNPLEAWKVWPDFWK